MTAVGAGLLCLAAVLLWPSRGRAASARDVLGAAAPGERGARDPSSWGTLWREDPVEILRRWRLRRRPADVEAAALALLDATAPALAAGLSPGAAVRLAGGSHAGASIPELHRFVRELDAAATAGLPSSAAWAGLAERSGSRPIAFVASAWRLSERTGAPLAAAVERAADALREARTRRRRVAVAAAGPRATVLVLTLLPLAGPLFGLACGISPRELYLGSPISLGSVLSGAVLVLLGRLWCRRLVRSAVGP